VHTIAARTRADSESSVALAEGGRGRTLTAETDLEREFLAKEEAITKAIEEKEREFRDRERRVR
jgi:hypothetical protein